MRIIIRRLIILMGVSLLLITHPATADPWYEHYANAEQAIEDSDWATAVHEINEALEEKGDSGARARSYGMNVTAYFPYFKLGIAYYHLGQLDAALQAFETEGQLGAIAQSDAATAELERYRGLAEEARAAAAAEEQQRIRQIVEQSLSVARDLEDRGLLDEAMAALDQALAVAPDHVEAQDTMSRLRQLFRDQSGARENEQRVSELIGTGRDLLDERNYSEASSVFREALFLKPSQEIQALLDEAQGKLLAELGDGLEVQQTSTDAELDAVRTLESSGQFAAALERLQSILVLEPTNDQAMSIQSRILQARKDAEAERGLQARIDQLLADAETLFEEGQANEALSAANRVLALDPGNSTALRHVAQAYSAISQKLLGTRPRGNIPPAVRFVDLRQEDEDGTLAETIDAPGFRLNGVVIDNSPVTIVFYDNNDKVLETELNEQPLGDFYLTEFNIELTLPTSLKVERPGGSVSAILNSVR